MDDTKFKRYEEDFANSSRIVGRGLKLLDNVNGSVDAIIQNSVDIEGELSEAEGYLKGMEVQYSIVKSNDYNGKMQQRLDDYKDEYTQLIKKYKLVKGNAETRAANGQSGRRAQLMAGNQKLDQSTSVLENSRKILYDTEKLGDTVLSDLESQREKLLSAQEKVQDTTTITFSAKNVLRQMGNRAIREKICIIFTILVLLIVIGVILYYGAYKKYYS